MAFLESLHRTLACDGPAPVPPRQEGHPEGKGEVAQLTQPCAELISVEHVTLKALPGRRKVLVVECIHLRQQLPGSSVAPTLKE